MKKNILIIEDDASIAELQRDYLEMSDFCVTLARDGDEGLLLLKSMKFDLVILDIMLPYKDGFEILKEISETKDMPVLIVSAKDDEMYKIKGLNLGADDYITKPFSMGEFVARVNSHLKIYDKFKNTSKSIDVRGLSVNPSDRRVFVNGNEVILKQKEFDLLLFLIQHPNHVYDKEALFGFVWGYNAISDATTVTVHIARIREKIEENPAHPTYIETVWGAGYRFKI